MFDALMFGYALGLVSFFAALLVCKPEIRFHNKLLMTVIWPVVVFLALVVR